MLVCLLWRNSISIVLRGDILIGSSSQNVIRHSVHGICCLSANELYKSIALIDTLSCWQLVLHLMSVKAQSVLPQSSPRASGRQGATRGDSRTVVKKMTLTYAGSQGRSWVCRWRHDQGWPSLQVWGCSNEIKRGVECECRPPRQGQVGNLTVSYQGE